MKRFLLALPLALLLLLSGCAREGILVLSPGSGGETGLLFPPQETSAPFDPDAPAEFVLHAETERFHLPTCAHAKRIGQAMRKEVTSTARALMDRGCLPCQSCLADCPRLPPNESGTEAKESLLPDSAPLSPDQLTDFLVHAKTRRFHQISCPHALRIAPENRLRVTARARQMLADGYLPCSLCMKDTLSLMGNADT